MERLLYSYIPGIVKWILLYIILVVGCVKLLEAHPGSWWRFPLMLLPMIPMFFILSAKLRILRKMDELEQRIYLEALAIAFGAGMLLSLSYWFLQIAGLPDISGLWIFISMAMLLGIGRIIARRKYS